jgi:ABC-type multidrug transport system, ATPase component
MIKLELKELTKIFERRVIFRNISLIKDAPGLFGVAGPNGSGKSTLVKVITGLLSPTSGSVAFSAGGREFSPGEAINHFGFASPYLVLYDEFSARENIEFSMKIRGASV